MPAQSNPETLTEAIDRLDTLLKSIGGYHRNIDRHYISTTAVCWFPESYAPIHPDVSHRAGRAWIETEGDDDTDAVSLLADLLDEVIAAKVAL